MKRLLIGCGMLTLCGTIANADPYEVIPFHTKGHLEKFLSPSRCESDSLTARGNGRMEEASHGAEGLFRC
jgi:hypothetical protein